MIIYYIFAALVIIVISILIGLNVSSTIDDTFFYILFWMMYILTVTTLFNIVLSIIYYAAMRNKQGPVGKQGDPGDSGEQGEAGLCTPDCRDSIAYNSILASVTSYLQQKSGNKTFKLRNVFIKQKIKQMCASDEFKQMAPYNGPNNLIKYLTDIWLSWCDIIINSGGLRYFETIGAEQDWNWVASNPFDELKKYDVFYWGLGPEYRPQLIDKCYISKDGVNIWKNGINSDGSVITTFKLTRTNNLTKIIDTSELGTKLKSVFFRPIQITYNSLTYYPLGDIIYAPKNSTLYNSGSVYVGEMTMPGQPNGNTPNIEGVLVAGDVLPPVDYKKIWSYNNPHTNDIIVIWRPMPPNGYIAMGDIVTTTTTKPAIGDAAPIRCVPSSIATIIKSPIQNNILWSSMGLNTNNYINCIGFSNSTNAKNFRPAADNKAYNLFRAVPNATIDIPNTDVYGSFYTLVSGAYDPNDVPGGNLGWPPTSSNKLIGRGYLANPRDEESSKYSIQGFLKLKNSMNLYNQLSGIKILLKTADNSSANTYNMYVSTNPSIQSTTNNTTDANNYNLCLSFSNSALGRQACSKNDNSQFFKVEFTGNVNNQCRIIHRETGYYVAVNPTSKAFKIVKNIDASVKNTSQDTTLFMVINPN